MSIATLAVEHYLAVVEGHREVRKKQENAALESLRVELELIFDHLLLEFGKPVDEYNGHMQHIFPFSFYRQPAEAHIVYRIPEAMPPAYIKFTLNASHGLDCQLYDTCENEHPIEFSFTERDCFLFSLGEFLDATKMLAQ